SGSGAAGLDTMPVGLPMAMPGCRAPVVICPARELAPAAAARPLAVPVCAQRGAAPRADAELLRAPGRTGLLSGVGPARFGRHRAPSASALIAARQVPSCDPGCRRLPGQISPVRGPLR